MRHTADHVVLACGADPIIPPITGLRELDGIWTNREATGMKAVPRRLLVLGGGPVGVEMAQAVRRLGGEVALVGRRRVLAREPAPLGEALAEVLRRDGIELVLGVHATAARREGDEYVLELDDGRELRGDRLLVATGRRPRVEGIGLETVGIEPNPRGVPVDARLRAGERLWAIGDVTGIWQLTHVGKYQGRVVASNLLGEPREAHYEAVPRVTYTDPEAAAVGATEAPLQRDRPGVRGGQDRHLHARVRRVQRLPDAAQRRRAADRRLRARARRPASGCSRPRSPSARASRSTCCSTRSSRSRPSRRSTSARSRPSARRSPGRVSAVHMPALDGATGWLNSEPLGPAEPARPRRARELLDADLHQLAAPGALRPRVVAGVPRRRADRRRRPHAGVRLRAGPRPRAPGDRGAGDRLPGRRRQRLRGLERLRQPLLAGALLRRPDGVIRDEHFGEGRYEQSERVIQQLLGVEREPVPVEGTGVEAEADWEHLRTPETYLGSARRDRFNAWALAGEWATGPENVVLEQAGGSITCRFHARDAHLVLAAGGRAPIPFRLRLDGQAPGPAHGVDVDPDGNGVLREGRMYQLVRSPDTVRERTLEITFLEAGAEAYAFTFG